MSQSLQHLKSLIHWDKVSEMYNISKSDLEIYQDHITEILIFGTEEDRIDMMENIKRDLEELKEDC